MMIHDSVVMYHHEDAVSEETLSDTAIVVTVIE